MRISQRLLVDLSQRLLKYLRDYQKFSEIMRFSRKLLKYLKYLRGYKNISELIRVYNHLLESKVYHILKYLSG